MRKYSLLCVLMALVFFITPGLLVLTQNSVKAESLPQVPVPGLVTMVDLGAKKCIPCKMMAPIIEELAREYEGRAAVIFIDVWENTDVPSKFGIRTIPTQIFYNAQGKEISRHEGFLDKESIVGIFTELGVK
ncbi:thioredoxin family protein [Desulfogranum japonicum]|uniref:thioredoxin family protein n=1 Tax=Desulfogranum japonicum TaxID=231447 RepID=UPI00048CC0A0|nr:thioredoxin family protein [Desulfogranum japonicum]